MPNDTDEMRIEGYAVVYDEPAKHTFWRIYFYRSYKKGGALDNTDLSDADIKI